MKMQETGQKAQALLVEKAFATCRPAEARDSIITVPFTLKLVIVGKFFV